MFGGLRLRAFSLILENQVKREMDSRMETWMFSGFRAWGLGSHIAKDYFIYINGHNEK